MDNANYDDYVNVWENRERQTEIRGHRLCHAGSHEPLVSRMGDIQQWCYALRFNAPPAAFDLDLIYPSAPNNAWECV